MPLERWDIERVYAPGLASDRMYACHAAWLGGVDRFDAALFGFSKAQATATDPQVLLGGPSANGQLDLVILDESCRRLRTVAF